MSNNTVWGVFYSFGPGVPYDLQGVWTSEEQAIDQANNMMLIPAAWKRLSTGHHWVTRVKYISDIHTIRVSPLGLNRVRNNSDNDPEYMRDEIDRMLQQEAPWTGHGDSYVPQPGDDYAPETS